jgi:murein DD-endopeptidase MepM/ murein hydrolase activator NlpD
VSSIGSIFPDIQISKLRADPTAKRTASIKGGSSVRDSGDSAYQMAAELRAEELRREELRNQNQEAQREKINEVRREAELQKAQDVQNERYQEKVIQEQEDQEQYLELQDEDRNALELQEQAFAQGSAGAHNGAGAQGSMGSLALSQLSMTGSLDPNRINEVGEDRAALESFESYMVQMMLREMRKTVPEGMFSSNAMDMFMDMFDQAIAEQLSKKGGIGLADTIGQQMGLSDGARYSGLESSGQGFQQGSSEGDMSSAMFNFEDGMLSGGINSGKLNVYSDQHQKQVKQMLQELEEKDILSPLTNRSSVWENWMMSSGAIPEELISDAALELSKPSNEADGQFSSTLNEELTKGIEAPQTTFAQTPYSNEALQELQELFSTLSSEMSLQDRIGEVTGKDVVTPEEIRHSLPVEGRVSSHFGMRQHPVSQEWKHHNGLDIAASTGTPIHPTASGLVTLAGERGGLGNVVVIDHGNGWMSTYAHCDELRVATGERVEQGQIIATVGETGLTTGPHLHLELRKDGILVNPAEILESSAPEIPELDHEHHEAHEENMTDAKIW